MSALQAILTGPRFAIRVHRQGLQMARGASRQWIIGELAANIVAIVIVFGFLRAVCLRYHYAAMAAGQCLTSFFAVWKVHHDSSRNPHSARTLRGRIKSALTFNMFFHLEHHLFPAVPTCHLPRLAQRLDEIAPDLREMQVM